MCEFLIRLWGVKIWEKSVNFLGKFKKNSRNFVNFLALNFKFWAKIWRKFVNFFKKFTDFKNYKSNFIFKTFFVFKPNFAFKANSVFKPNFVFKTKKIHAFFLIFTATFFLNGCDFNKNFTALNSDESFDFDFNGFEKRLNLGTQKPFMLVFFTKDCGICKTQIRILNEFKNAQGFDFFVVLNDAANKAEAMLYAQNYDIKFPLFYEKRASEFLSKAVGGIYGVPVIVFFDKNGIQRRSFIGLTPQNTLQKELSKLI